MSVASPTTHSDITQLIIATSIASCINVYGTCTIRIRFPDFVTRAYCTDTAQSRQLVSCITYFIVFNTSRIVLFLHIKVQHEFSKGFAVSIATWAFSAKSCSELSCMTRTHSPYLYQRSYLYLYKAWSVFSSIKTTTIFLQPPDSYWRNKYIYFFAVSVNTIRM